MRWTYYIESHLITPMNTRRMEISRKLADSPIYDYRLDLNNPIVLQGADYDYIKTIENTDAKHTFTMYDSGILHFTGEFTKHDISFDDYKSNCSIKISPRDSYTEIQENEDIEVNVIGDATDVTIDLYSYWHFYTVRNGSGDGTYTKILNTSVGFGIGQTVSLYVTELIKLHSSEEIPSGFDTTVYVDLGDFKVYRRFPVDFPLVWTNDGLLLTDTSDYKWSGLLFYRPPYDESTHTYYKLSSLTSGFDLNFGDLWVKKSAYNGRANFIVTKSYPAHLLRDVFNRILETAMPDFTGVVKSGVLFNDAAETGKVYPSGYPLATYTKYLIEMSDFTTPDATQSAEKGILTLKQAIDYFTGKHDLYWSIDADGNLRIEDYAYYDTILFGIMLTDTTRKYSRLQNDKPNRMYMTEAQAWNEDFSQIEVLFGTVPALNGVKESTKTISLSNIYTDIDGLNAHLEELSSGFVYVDVSAGAVVKSTGFKSGETNLQNATLSNANCLNTHYRRNAYQQTFYIGGREVEAVSLKRMIKNEPVFTSSSIPDVRKKVNTPIGAGVFNSLTYAPVEEYTFKAEVLI